MVVFGGDFVRKDFQWLAPVLVILGVATRLLPHPANFTAVGALAIWAATLFGNSSKGLLVTLGALAISDLFLGFHSTILWVYGAFVVIALAAPLFRPRASGWGALAASLFASLLFFGITNFGVWWSAGLYPQTAQGLVDCFVMAVPFLKNQIAGDLVYTFAIGAAARALANCRETMAASAV